MPHLSYTPPSPALPCAPPRSLALTRCHGVAGLALAAPLLARLDLKECEELRGARLQPVSLHALELGASVFSFLFNF